MTVKGFGALAAMAAAAAMLLVPSAASASHVAGATYTGTIEGGGTVEVTMSPDGSAVSSFAVANLPTTVKPGGVGPCAPVTTAFTGGVPVMVLSSDPPRHFFSTMIPPSQGIALPLDFDVYDDRPNEISGRLSYGTNDCGNTDPAGGFPGENVRWLAALNGGCLNSDFYTTAKANLDKLNAEVAALKAKAKKLAKKAKKALAKGNDRRADELLRKRRKVRRQLRRVVEKQIKAQTVFDFACA